MKRFYGSFSQFDHRAVQLLHPQRSELIWNGANTMHRLSWASIACRGSWKPATCRQVALLQCETDSPSNYLLSAMAAENLRLLQTEWACFVVLHFAIKNGYTKMLAVFWHPVYMHSSFWWRDWNIYSDATNNHQQNKQIHNYAFSFSFYHSMCETDVRRMKGEDMVTSILLAFTHHNITWVDQTMMV